MIVATRNERKNSKSEQRPSGKKKKDKEVAQNIGVDKVE